MSGDVGTVAVSTADQVLELGARDARRTTILIDGAWLLACVRGLRADRGDVARLLDTIQIRRAFTAKGADELGRVAGVVLGAIEIHVALAVAGSSVGGTGAFARDALLTRHVSNDRSDAVIVGRAAQLDTRGTSERAPETRVVSS